MHDNRVTTITYADRETVLKHQNKITRAERARRAAARKRRNAARRRNRK